MKLNPKSLAILLLALAVSGCDSQQPESVHEGTATATAQKTEPTADPAPAGAHPAAEPSPERAEQDRRGAAIRAEPELAQPLDLSLPPDVLSGLSDAPLPDNSARLPDMFQERDKAAGKTSLSGKLLMEKNHPDTLQSINGAELTVERKLD
jgi:hypothetical protein